jgi:hypothetical protein
MNQNQACDEFLPQIFNQGKIYLKYGLVFVYLATPGQYIETWTADGLETTNYANDGDFVVRNLQTEWQEEYIVCAEVLFKRYELFYFTDNGAVLIPKGKIQATIHHGEDLEFVAKWGRLMALKKGDFIVSPYPELNEVYRIARKEFFETYEEVQ